MTAQITDCRLEILYFLYDHRVLTTSQIHREVRNNERRKDTWRDLAKLRELELIKGVALEPDKGKASEFYWFLTKKGAQELGHTPLTTKVKNPEPRQVEFKTHQLELECQVKTAGLLLIKPQHFNVSRPKPVETRQSEIMLKYLDFHFSATNRNQTYRLYRPLGVNDYLAHTPKHSQIFIFILCPPDAGRKFWEGRASLYKRFSERYGQTWAVFTSENQRETQLERLLSEAKIKNLILADVPKVITESKK